MTAFGSLYTAATGLQAFGQGMSVIGNNIANVNTTGFKSTSIHFADVFNDTVVTGGGVGQVGKGVQLADLITDFDSGPLELTTESLDLALGGNGFFVVSPPDSDKLFYTRSGAFRFDKQGYLKDSGGAAVQGYEVQTRRDPTAVTTEGASGAGLTESIDFGNMVDVRLGTNAEDDRFVSSPERTTRIEVMVNLDSQATDLANTPAAASSPAFSLFNAWDASQDEPLDSAKYTYMSPLTVYDQAGNAHRVSAYFDPVYTPSQGDDVNGTMVWEYLLAMDPSEDGRAIAQGSSKSGVLMMGTMTFDASGELVNQSAFTPDTTGNMSDLASWTGAFMSDDGYFLCDPVFVAADGQELEGSIEVNFGLADTSPHAPDPLLTAADIPALDAETALQMLGMVQDPSRLANASTSYNRGSATLYQNQNGYPEGALQALSVDRDGVLTGHYSNGQERSLFVLAVADCPNRFALHREGGNRFAETPDCGGMQFGLAGTGNARFDLGPDALDGLGTIASSTLEQSNVDMATAFVDMILTQKGFQANSKVVSTSDEILKMLNEMKR
ncbi:flagellar hook protein FlgE [Desulfoplanes formicivorans]|uniref:Flagellar hook protein FlgE n=1 Tax=Desulfoplanes formicivorans TaxID=1592317 RepID=A0A194AHP9_9BACT|nr:flagellar hook-basal body complex protein [Desulfoplanes formicivorans]GAU09607.1 flagellar hook protein FlgE [Desulfoplanes formicivorans]